MKKDDSSKKPAIASNQNTYELKSLTLVDIINKNFESTHHCLIFVDAKYDETRLYPKQIIEGATAAAHYFLANGLEKGDKVIILLPTGPEFVQLFFGVLIAGGIPITSPQPLMNRYLDKYLSTIKQIAINSEAKFFIGHNRIRSIIGSLGDVTGTDIQYRDIHCVFEPLSPNMEFCRLPHLQPSDIAFIQYTSGTLGNPRGVMLTHENILNNVHALGIATGMTKKDVGISWLPLYHDMGLIGTLFSSLYWQWPLILMSPKTFLLKPHTWMRNITHYKATLSVSPNFGYAYCTKKIDDRFMETFDLTSWRLAINGAEPINVKTLSAFLDRFGSQGLRRDVFFPVYGIAENCLAVTMPPLDKKTTTRKVLRKNLEKGEINQAVDDCPSESVFEIVSVGSPIPGHSVRIVDKKGNLLTEKKIGEVQVKGPCVTLGYHRSPEATARTIQDGWLKTGDLGFLWDGLLYIAGRSKEMIIRAGKNYYPYDIEKISESVPGIQTGCCTAFGILDIYTGADELVLICESCETDEEMREKIKKQINAELLMRLGLRADTIKIIPPGAMPKTSSGKIERLLCKEYYLKEVMP